MNIKWNKLLTNLVIWTFTEVTLNLVGLDTLADYTEFLSHKHHIGYEIRATF